MDLVACDSSSSICRRPRPFLLPHALLWVVVTGVTAVAFPAQAKAPDFVRVEISNPRSALKEPYQRLIREISDTLLNEYEVSYAYGGAKLGQPETCQACNSCLVQLQPKGGKRLMQCPACQQCSLDCSHFVHLVYEKAGFKMPYLATATMLNASEATLRQSYHLRSVDDLAKALPGDLLVYSGTYGHVVLLEKLYPDGRGDIIHATGGREIREPGQGIQRERNTSLLLFHGPLRRILRPSELGLGDGPAASAAISKVKPAH